jgi:Mn-containing catalase
MRRRHREANGQVPAVAWPFEGVNLYNLVGSAWTADYRKITGELDVDLRNDIPAEARAKIVYARLLNFCGNPDSKDACPAQSLRSSTLFDPTAFAGQGT